MAFKSIQLSVWSKFGPDEGFFPLAVAIIIVGLSLIIIIRTFLTTEGEKRKKITEEQKKRERIFKVSAYSILMLIYGLLIERIGFLISSTLVIIPLLKIVERQTWKATVLLGFGSIVICYVLFVYFLSVPLPKGLIRGW